MGLGGGSNRATREAERAERERQAAIRAAQRQIDSIFDSSQRAADISEVIAAARDLALDDLNRTRSNAARTARFSLARSGLTGGSQAIDLNRRIADDFLRGTLQSERGAQQVGANLRALDEEARQNLLALAQSGLDATTAAQQSANALRANIANAQANQPFQDFSSLFGGVADVLDASNQARQRRLGFTDFNNSLFQRGAF